MSGNSFFSSLNAIKENEAQAAAVPESAQEAQLLADIVTKIPQKNRGISVTYYLSKATVQAVEREAKRRGVGRGKLVDEVLKRVLLEP